MKPTDEQVKKFWEWCGFKVALGKLYWYPDKESSPARRLPPIDPNNLFKYAMPAIREHNLWLELEKTGITTSFWCIDINPAIELFWSIWQVIEGEVIKESE